jgi:hypothetical protein
MLTPAPEGSPEAVAPGAGTAAADQPVGSPSTLNQAATASPRKSVVEAQMYRVRRRRRRDVERARSAVQGRVQTDRGGAPTWVGPQACERDAPEHAFHDWTSGKSEPGPLDRVGGMVLHHYWSIARKKQTTPSAHGLRPSRWGVRPESLCAGPWRECTTPPRISPHGCEKSSLNPQFGPSLPRGRRPAKPVS